MPDAPGRSRPIRWAKPSTEAGPQTPRPAAVEKPLSACDGRAQIYEHIWGAGSDVDESAITVFVRKIREKIEDNPSQPKYLLTVWRVGYKFVEKV